MDSRSEPSAVSVCGSRANAVEFRERVENRFDRYGESDALRVPEHHRVDTDYPAVFGEQRAAADAGIDGRVCLKVSPLPSRRS